MRAISAFVLTVITLASFSLIKPTLESKLNQVEKAKELFQQSIMRAYQDLTGIAYEILEETNLKLNLQWQLEHSNQGILKRYVHQGRVSFLRVFDENCHVITNSETGIMTGSPCLIPQALQSQKPKFHWILDQDQPLLALMMPFKVGDKNFFLLIGTYLNQLWFRQQANLLQLADRIPLKVKPYHLDSSEVLLVQEGYDPSRNQFIANLVTDDWLLNAFPSLLNLQPESLTEVVLYLSILTLVLLFNVVILLKARDSRFMQRLEEFRSWVQNLSPLGNQDQSKAFADATSYLDEIRDHIKKLHDFHFSRDRELQNTIQIQNQDLKKMEQKYLELQQKVMKSQRHESFRTQFLQISGNFQDLQDQLCEQTENVYDTLTHGLSATSNQVYQIMSHWQKELDTMSPRKFLRSLSERPAAQQPQRSELDVTIQKLIDLSRQLSNMGLHCSVEIQKIMRKLRHGRQIIKHWGDLTTNQNQYADQLLMVLLEGQNLIPMTCQVPPHRFENLIEENYSLKTLNIPQSILVSITYHLNMSLIERHNPEGNPGPILIEYRLKRRNRVSTLVVSCKTRGLVHHDTIRSERGQFHWDLAHELLTPYGLELVELPDLHGITSYALSWQEKATITIQNY